MGQVPRKPPIRGRVNTPDSRALTRQVAIKSIKMQEKDREALGGGDSSGHEERHLAMGQMNTNVPSILMFTRGTGF